MMPSMTRRAALAGGVAFAAPAAAAPTAIGADPILGAIERHRKANLDWSAALKRRNAELEHSASRREGDAPSHRDCEAAADRESETYAALWRTVPTTPLGMAEYFRYLQEPRFPPVDPDKPVRVNAGVPWTIVEYMATEDGPVDDLTAWAGMIELALRRMAPELEPPRETRPRPAAG